MVSQAAGSLDDHKSDVRSRVWSELRKVAYPDSRFHYDFNSFIADFEGSRQATERLLRLPSFNAAQLLFIAPDNCLEYLRLAILRAGKAILMTTYGIRRGFWLLDPRAIPEELYVYASTLDGMEKVGTHICLREMRDRNLTVDMMITGTGAINREGIRFGKGHGYFDLEWGMLSTLHVASQDTTTVCLVHDCQVLDETLQPDEFDTVCDVIVTPKGLIDVQQAQKPKCGILWPRLQPGMMEGIPPLRELKELEASRDS